MKKGKQSMASRKTPTRAKSSRPQARSQKKKQGLGKRVSNNKLLSAVIFVGLFGVIGGALLFASQAASTTKTVTFTPTHDTFASEFVAAEPRDEITFLRVNNSKAPCSTNVAADCRTSNSRVTYIKFYIKGIPSSYTTIDSVKLKLYTTNNSNDGGNVYRANATSWDETSLTYDNQPGYDPAKVLGSLGSVTSGSWREITLRKGAVNGGERGAVAFAIANNDADMAAYASRETGTPPQLIITYTESPPPPTFNPAYPGQPRPGKAYWGTSFQGGDDPTAKHETPTGDVLGVRREFFQGSQVDYALGKAKIDLAKGRIPVMSFKAPASWTTMASGSQDAWIDGMLKKFDSLGGPVWLVMHHEPEGGGGVNSPDESSGPAGHLAMNKHVRERMTALNTTNIALALTLMGCTYSYDCQGREPKDWYSAGVYDIIAADTYWSYSSPPSTTLLQTSSGAGVRKFAYERGKDSALFEWGLGSHMDAEGARYMQGLFDGMIAAPPSGQARVVAASYFDTTLNGGVPLSGTVLEKFHQIMKDPNSTNWPSEKLGAPLQ